jgi:hypothetical protein
MTSATTPAALPEADQAGDCVAPVLTFEEAVALGVMDPASPAEEQAANEAEKQARWSAGYLRANPGKARESRPELTPRQLGRLVKQVTTVPRWARAGQVRAALRRARVSRPHVAQAHRGSTRMQRPVGRRVRRLASRSSRDGPSSSSDDPPGGAAGRGSADVALPVEGLER